MGRRGPGAIPAPKNQGEDNVLTLFEGRIEDRAPAVPVRRWREDPDLSRAERVIAFLEDLPITSGAHAGRKMALRPWQRDIIEQIYATDAGNKRQVRTAVVSMPRKNGKTALAAGLALAHLIGPEAEPRGQVYSAAVDRDQSALIFNEMVAMIKADPEYQRRVNIQAFAKRIEDYETGSTYSALSSDARKGHGLNASFVIYDELAQARDRKLYESLATSMGARAEPLMIVISTQAADDQHFLSELIDYGVKVRDGLTEDPTFHLTLYTAPEDADPWDEKTWHACNPALGDFRSLEEFQTFAERASRVPSLEQTFRNLYLNQRVEAESRFINRAEWQACSEAPDVRSLRGKPCFGGLDLGATRDLTALVLVFPDDKGGFDVLPYFWCPRDLLREKEDAERVPYFTWANKGFIEATPGKSTDYGYVVHRIAELAAEFDIKTIAYDRWRIEILRRQMDAEGVNVRLSEFGQGFKDMSPAVDALETAIIDGKLRHGGHPILTWNASNAVVDSDPAGNRKLSKDKSREKIDGLVALAMAIGLSRRDQGERRSPTCLTDGPIILM